MTPREHEIFDALSSRGHEVVQVTTLTNLLDRICAYIQMRMVDPDDIYVWIDNGLRIMSAGNFEGQLCYVLEFDKTKPVPSKLTTAQQREFRQVAEQLSAANIAVEKACQTVSKLAGL